ncbi:26067_t:CDS:10, partial [Dentiscutata erythropus]
TGVEFEVMKSQEEKEDFIPYPGFKIKLPSEIKREINVDNADCPLPFIIESTFHQAFATVKKIRGKSKTNKHYKTVHSESEFHEIIEGHTFENELLSPLNDALAAERLALEKRKENERNIISEDGKIIENMFWNKLKETYSAFEDFISTSKTNSSHMSVDGVSEIQNDTDLKRIHVKYPNINKRINSALKITSKNWIELRKLFEFVAQIIDTQVEGNETIQDNNDRNEAIKELCNLLVDQEIDFNKQKTDSQFIQDLHSYKFENIDEITKHRITFRFLDVYQEWRNDTFYTKMKKGIPKYSDQSRDINSRLEDESKVNQKEINNREFPRICEAIEKKYSNGFLQSQSLVTYHFEEIQPEQLQYTIYNTSLDQNDTLSLRQDELHVSNPTIDMYHHNNCFSFLINPQAYELRKIALFENNKYFIALWNINQKRLEIYYETLRRTLYNPIQLEETAYRKPKTLHPEEQCLIAVNEPKGMIGIYQTRIGVLDVYVIDESQQFYKRAGGVQICAWYSNNIPDIKFLFFIKDKEEICFVQIDGQARIFNLVTNQFLPGTAHFPVNASNIVCTPDGSCIVAFVEENPSEENPSGENPSGEDMPNEQDNESDLSISDTEDSTNESNNTNGLAIKRAYIYFSSGFGRPASKVIQLPPIISTLEFIQFSCLENQVNLTAFDIHAGVAIKNYSQDMELEGNDTSFMRDVKKGENFVIMGEKRIVLKVYSDTKLKVSGTFQCMIGIDSWMEFRIEPKTKLSGFINAYKLMFEKYPIDNIIDPDQNRTLNLQIALDLKDNEKISNYENKFQDYVADMFEELKRSTNKPATSIKRFGWYEGIFKYFGDKPVKVVSSMGEQSCGKSYMLNHLIGTTFDGSAMRCTEGRLPKNVSMSPWISRDLNLLNGHHKKNQFAVNRDMSTMFQRFQDGATLLNDEKIFQAKLCIIIKDVPKQDRDGILSEFSLRFKTMVMQEGENNFIIKMYPGGLNINPWPMFNNPEWFKSLRDIKKMLDKQDAKYANARTFLQNTKVSMAKLKANENLVQIRVSTLKRLLDIAISLGIEEKTNTIEHLTNRDTGEIIPDQVINLTEIYDEIKDECDLILDSDLRLLDENTDFVPLSADLRIYFEDKVQSRRDCSNDAVWFEKLSKFFKFIIQRRINRAQEWFQQNTSKFSPDNSDVKDGAYALEHICQSKRHNCGAPCSLQANTKKGFYKCPNKCIIPCEDEHEQHCCENDSACPIQCPIPDCQRRCQSTDHFHALQPQQIHFCGNEHQCQEDCQELGVCRVITEPKKQEEVYQGLVQGTSFTFTKYIQLSERVKCCKKIPPNAFHHEGKHSHEENGFHFCDAKCQFCEYYCILPYGHPQALHETKHGNMTQTEFTSEEKEFVYRGHKFRAGDHGTFVLCNLYCKEFGRHRHIDYCQDASTCKPSANKQHIDDPYSAQEQEIFEKCDHECADEIHKPTKGSNVVPNRSFCELPLFNAPLKLSDAPPNGIGYISLGGHHFKCDNPAKREGSFHIIFTIDRSGSMDSSDKKPITNTPVYNLLKTNHDNRTGAVYSAVYSFMETRLAAQARSKSTNKDTISLILFDHEVIVPFENHVLTDSKLMLNQMLPHKARGGTDFNLAIQKAGSLINNYFDTARANVIIFLSDGGCSTPKGQLEQICKYNNDKGNPLYLITVLFAGGNDSPSLREMAGIASRYHPANTIVNALRCQFTSVMTEINLVNTFTSVAESLRAHNPSLMKKL